MYSFRYDYICRVIYFEISLKIKKTLNRYNFEDNDLQSTNERSLEAQKLAL